MGPVVCCCWCPPIVGGCPGGLQQRGWLPRAAGLGGEVAVEHTEPLGFPPPQCPSSAGHK